MIPRLARQVYLSSPTVTRLFTFLQVTVVAQVLQINPQATNCVYILDDGTGRIEARHWVDNASETNAQKWAGLK